MKTNTFPLIFSIKNFPFFLISHINHLKDELSQNKKNELKIKLEPIKLSVLENFIKLPILQIFISALSIAV